MKLVTWQRDHDEPRLGALIEDDTRVVDLTADGDPRLASMLALMDAGNDGLALAQSVLDQNADSLALDDVALCLPARPVQMRDVLCFQEHVFNALNTQMRNLSKDAADPQARYEELKASGEFDFPPLLLEQPVYYKGNRFAAIGTEQDVIWPQYSDVIDYELEIGCWIGRKAKDVNASDADSYVFGYSVFNDWSARDAQMREMAGSLHLGPAKGKDFDTANAIGPCIVTADSIDISNVAMIARVNGDEVSRGSSSSMTWKFPQVIEHISASETLYPGEMIGSGTVGWGCGLERGEFPSSGDVVELEIEGIGVLRNRVVKG